jgi:magnesium-transporting ATPase (P-type)
LTDTRDQIVDDQKPTRRPWLGWIAILTATALFIAAILVRYWRSQRARKLVEERRPGPPVILPTLRGLTEAEAEARRLEGEDNVIQFQPPRTPQQIWRENTFTIFNLSLVGLAVVQFLLGLPLDGLLSLGMIVLNTGLNAAQELIARRRLREVEVATRPHATVIREGRARSIDPSEIVRGDLLVVGPGDQLLVDGALSSEGPIVVDESMLTGARDHPTKRAGDLVYAGSFCISGRAAYETQKVGSERLIASLTAGSSSVREDLTSLERIVDRVLRGLLIVVALFTVLLLLRYFRLDTVVDVDAVADVANVIFSIVPASLFFMIFLTYASGTADLAKIGALVHRSRSVESLAQATVVCFAQAGILTGIRVELEPIEPPGDGERVAESRLRQILGDFARSSSTTSPIRQALASAFEGGRRAPQEEAPFLSLYGWSAIAFDDDDLRGVYVLGEPEVLEAYLVSGDEKPAEEEGEAQSTLAAFRQRIPSLGRFLRRSKEEPEEKSTDSAPQQGELEAQGESQEAGEPDTTTSSGEDVPRPNLFRRLAGQVSGVLRREGKVAEGERAKDEIIEEVVYLLAYRPQLVPLHAEDGLPRLPNQLIPLCRLHYAEQVRPEAIETIKTFSRMDVGIKVFSAGDPDRVAAILERGGLGAGSEEGLRAISGPELADLDPEEVKRAAAQCTVFGHVTPEQAGQVVTVLREQGEAVAVVGDGVNDLPAMRQAGLSIARQSSSQAALGLADIVLLEDSPGVLLRVLEKGQRIVNGLLDVLKLYLAQILYLVVLIVAIRLTAAGFPYVSKQGSLIGIVTLSIPALGLSLWATAGVLHSARLGQRLARFVGPAAVTLGATGMAVYWFFLDRTGEMAYAQLALTYTLVISGLVLVVFVRPPWPARVGRVVQGGDWRPAALILVLLALFFLAASLPLAEQLFQLTQLRQPADYLFVGLAVLAWALLLRFVWLLVPQTRRI